MDSHRYRVGQTVRFVRMVGNTAFGKTPAGTFRIVSLLPDYQGNNQYRVESTSNSRQRIVEESKIFPT